MRDLVLQTLPALVEAPAERGYPGQARLDQHDLKLGIALEHALDDQARDRGLQRGGVLGDLLDIERWPAGVRHRAAARAKNVDADGQPGFDRGLEDRPIAAL